MTLSLGQTIYELRKKKDMTQEQLAALLHISNVAVSKWENNNTYPDIALLKPLARCLDVTVDELLNFHAFLDEEQLALLKKDISLKFEEGNIEDAINLAEQSLNEYPTDLSLKFQIGSLYFRYASAKFDEDFMQEQFKKATLLLEKATDSEDKVIQEASKLMLITLYSSNEEYEKALSIIDSMPVNIQDIRMMKASILYQKGEFDEAMKLYQSCLWSELNNVRLNLMSLAKSYRTLKQYDDALALIEKALQLSNTFEINDLINLDMNLYLFKIELLLKLNKTKEALSVFKIMSNLFKEYKCIPDKQHLIFGQVEFNVTMSKSYLINNTLLMFEENKQLACLHEEMDYQNFINILKSYIE